MRSGILMTAALCAVFTGCTHHQLRFNTVKQAKTVADVHTKQVLDNVAKFVDNPHALPHFSYPNGGVAAVTDSGNGNVGFRFSPFRLLDWATGVSGTRATTSNYTMTPINDPRKLELMRCAYQRAIYGCGSCCESSFCPDCQKRFNAFYLGSTAVSKAGEVSYEGNSIHRVKQSVSLIYYSGEGRNRNYVPVTQSDRGSYVVKAANSDANEIVYQLYRTEGETMQGIPADATFYKLSDVAIESLDELKLVVEKLKKTNAPESALSIQRSGVPVSVNYLDDLIATNQVVVENKKIYLVGPQEANFFQADQATAWAPQMFDVRGGLQFENMSEEARALVEATVRIPVALESSDLDRPFVDLTIGEQTRRNGKVSVACLCEDKWFCKGRCRDAPKFHTLVGRHGDVAVWVSDAGRDQLAKLTLTILDIATNDAPSTPTTDVIAFIGSDGRSVSKLEDASYVAKATLARGSSVAGILPSSATVASPPNESEVQVLTELSKDLRQKFAILIPQIDPAADVRDLLNEVAGETPTEVEFIGDDFRKLKVDVQKSDLLVPLAARFLIPEKDDLQVSPEVRKAAEDFLNAEYQRQNLKSFAEAPDAILIGERELPKRAGVSSELLQLQNRLNALGLP